MFVVGRSRTTAFLVVLTCIYLAILLEGKSKTKCTCWRGHCDELTGACICEDGWFGERCQFCRQRLTADSGIITDGPWKYKTSSRCMWLIESNSPNTSIELTLEHFATECSWDHLYVYDGSSVQAPVMAAYSGVLRDNGSTETLRNPVRKLRSTSSTIYVCFYSDKHVNHDGFTIKYSVLKECSSLCSYHGNCNAAGVCVCRPGWTGATCSTPTCIYKCVSGTCNSTTWSCDCKPGYSGPLCNSTSGYGFWTKHTVTNQDAVQGRASHAAGVLGDWVWVFGGYSLIKKQFDDFIRYSFSTNKWEVVSYSGKAPGRRYGHSLVVYNNSLIIFGGAALNGQTFADLWCFNTITKKWTRIKLSINSSLPIAVSGHTATLVNNRMVVLFGYGPTYGYTPYVQELNLVTNQWKIYNYTLSKKGTYGHSSVYDPVSGLIYVYAGSSKKDDKGITDTLHSYDPVTHRWTKLDNSHIAQYLHSAVLIGHLMLIYGGNTVAMQIKSSTTTCFDSKFLVYDLICGQWRTMPKQSLPGTLLGRLGQAGFFYDSKMYIFGGFNGGMLNDLLSYSLGDCSTWNNKTSCLESNALSGCFWDPGSNRCVGPTEGFTIGNSYERPRCKKLCNASATCNYCKAQGLQCKWCDYKCKERADSCSVSQTCNFIPDQHCSSGQNCQKLKCETRKSCLDCVGKDFKRLGQISCMWCEAQQRCVVGNTYIVSFPYGQCNHWVTDKQHCSALKCSSQSSCSSCHKLPECGWCDDGSGMGVGRCIKGGASGPFLSRNSIVPETCSNWFFMKCPACQCNGHSTCDKDGKCINCKDNTKGRHCQFCSVGFHGDAVNGGKCKACTCNKHAKECHPVDSKCYCLVKGITGHHCERCESEFVGNASNGGLCFYRLQISEPGTFNFSGKTSINYQFKPVLRDHDLDFMVAISEGASARINITFLTKDHRSSTVKEKFILKNYSLEKLKKKFSQREYAFNKKYVTFRAYIYDIEKTATVKVMAVFVQQSNLNIDLLEFFLTFFGCFLSLLCVASIGWKIRSRYHSYLVTRQNRVERDRMANRPFATVNLLLPNEVEILCKSSPNPIAMEPLVKNKVAITTVVVLLPNGEDGVPPVGQCGICFASMLMSHGSHSHSGIKSRMGRKKNRKRSTMTTYHV